MGRIEFFEWEMKTTPKWYAHIFQICTSIECTSVSQRWGKRKMTHSSFEKQHRIELTAGVVVDIYVTGTGLRVVVVVIGSDFSVACVGGIYVG